MHKLKYISENVLADLKSNVTSNFEHYRSTGFEDKASVKGWSLALNSVEIDANKLAKLDPSGGSDVEVRNSILMFEAFSGMTPALATEERVWTRLTHFECLDFARNRWPLRDEPKEKTGLPGRITVSKEKAAEQRKKVLHQNIGQVEAHYFARGHTGYRDDNAVSRLWWNALIASRVDAADQEGVLKELLRTAYIRSNLVGRPMVSNRTNLLRGIVRTMRNKPEVYGSRATFREFMKALNLRGSGVLFEALSDQETDATLLRCRDDALERIQNPKRAV